MRVIRKRPGEQAELIEIENALKALQAEVGGCIEVATFAEDAAIICYRDGRLDGKPHNCYCLGVDFCGTILVVGVDGDEFCDAPEITLRIFSQNEKSSAIKEEKQCKEK